jgi:hypothetical protein
MVWPPGEPMAIHGLPSRMTSIGQNPASLRRPGIASSGLPLGSKVQYCIELLSQMPVFDGYPTVVAGKWDSLYHLMCLRATIGPASFASEKQGIPVNPEQCEWDASYFDYPGFWFEQWPQEIKTLGLDNATSSWYAGIKIYRRWLDRGVELSVALMRFSFLDARLLRQRPHSVVPAGLVRSADSAAFFAQRISFAPWSLWPPAARAAFAAGA